MALVLAVLAGGWSVPAAAAQFLLERSCLLASDGPLTLEQARAAQGWNCAPDAADAAHSHVWLRVEGSAFEQGDDILLNTDTLGFERLTTVVELTDGTRRVLGYDADDLGRYWTVGTSLVVPLLAENERAERIWLRIDNPLDRNTAVLANLTTQSADAQQRLVGMVLFALFCGMLVVVVIYSLSLSIALRSSFALWHGLMVLLFLGYTVSASSLLLMALPDLTLWQRSATSYLLLALSMAMVTPFFLSFLEPGVLPRWTARLMAGISLSVAAAGIAFVLLAHEFPFWARPAYHAAFIPLLLGFAVVCPLAWLRGSEVIRLVAVAWSLPVIVAVDRVLRGLNLYIMPTEWDFIFYAAMAWQSVVMAAAITWRIGRIRRERDVARAQEQMLGAMALTDGLTGLPNRRAFDARDWREGDFLCVVDADHFKQVNDRHGHLVGDEVLRVIGAELTRATGTSTECIAAFRLGGEEFAVLVAAGSSEEAALAANRIRLHLSEAVRSAVPELTSPLTLSVGLARIGSDGVTAAFRAADRALYKAKNSGRDLLCYETLEVQGSAMIFPRGQKAA